MKISNLKKFLAIFLLTILLFNVTYVFALEVKYPRIPGAKYTPNEIAELIQKKQILREDMASYYFQYWFNFSIIIGVLICLFAIIFGGIKLLISKDKPLEIVSARSWASSGLLGLLIILSSYLILATISPELVGLKIKIPPAPVQVRGPVISEKQVANFYEVPTGKLIEETLAKLEKPTDKTLVEELRNIKEKSSALKNALAELNKLTLDCTCGLSNCEAKMVFKGTQMSFECKTPPIPQKICNPKCDKEAIKRQMEEVRKLIAKLEAERARVTTFEVLTMTNFLKIKKAQALMNGAGLIYPYYDFDYQRSKLKKDNIKTNLLYFEGFPNAFIKREGASVYDPAAFYFSDNLKNKELVKETERLNSILILSNTSLEEYETVIAQIIKESLGEEFFGLLSDSDWKQIIEEALSEATGSTLEKALSELSDDLLKRIAEEFKKKLKEKVEKTKCLKIIEGFDEFLDLNFEKALNKSTTTAGVLRQNLIDIWVRYHATSGQPIKDVLNKNFLAIVATTTQILLTEQIKNLCPTVSEITKVISPTTSQVIKQRICPVVSDFVSKKLSDFALESYTSFQEFKCEDECKKPESDECEECKRCKQKCEEAENSEECQQCKKSKTLAVLRKFEGFIYKYVFKFNETAAEYINQRLSEWVRNGSQQLAEWAFGKDLLKIPAIEDAVEALTDLAESFLTEFVSAYLDIYLSGHLQILEEEYENYKAGLLGFLSETLYNLLVPQEWKNVLDSNLISIYNNWCQEQTKEYINKRIEQIKANPNLSDEDKSKQIAEWQHYSGVLCNIFTDDFLNFLPLEVQKYLTTAVIDLLPQDIKEALLKTPMEAFPWLSYLRKTLFEITCENIDQYVSEELQKPNLTEEQIQNLNYFSSTCYILKNPLRTLLPPDAYKSLIDFGGDIVNKPVNQFTGNESYSLLHTPVKNKINEICNNCLYTTWWEKLNEERAKQGLAPLNNVIDLFGYEPVGHLVKIIKEYLKPEELPPFTRILIYNVFGQSILNFIRNDQKVEAYKELADALDLPEGVQIPLGLNQPEVANLLETSIYETLVPTPTKELLKNKFINFLPFANLGEESIKGWLEKCSQCYWPENWRFPEQWPAEWQWPDSWQIPQNWNPWQETWGLPCAGAGSLTKEQLNNLDILSNKWKQQGRLGKEEMGAYLSLTCKVLTTPLINFADLEPKVKEKLDLKLYDKLPIWFKDKQLIEFLFPDCWKFWNQPLKKGLEISDDLESLGEEVLKEIDIEKIILEKMSAFSYVLTDILLKKVAEKTGKIVSETKFKDLFKNINSYTSELSKKALNKSIENGILLNSLKNLKQ